MTTYASKPVKESSWNVLLFEQHTSSTSRDSTAQRSTESGGNAYIVCLLDLDDGCRQDTFAARL